MEDGPAIDSRIAWHRRLKGMDAFQGVKHLLISIACYLSLLPIGWCAELHPRQYAWAYLFPRGI